MNNQLSRNLQRLMNEKRKRNGNKKQSLNRVNNTKKKKI